MSTRPPQPAPEEYVAFLQKLAEREKTLTSRIANKKDPIDVIQTIVGNEGQNLKTLWEADPGYPVDGILICIILIPIFLGVIGNYFFSIWMPHQIKEELYDEYGRKIVEYPLLPIAYLQQSPKDQIAARENRNSLAWLCHKWLISTNDVVQELQSTYPVEQYTVSGWGTVKALARLNHLFHTAVKKRNVDSHEQKPITAYPPAQMALIDKIRKVRMQASEKIEQTKEVGNVTSLFMRAPAKDVNYIKQRIPSARRLWFKLYEWIKIYKKRTSNAKLAKDDSKDTYWTSSETYSTDSGQHWKSYRGKVQLLMRHKKEDVGWEFEKLRREREKLEKALKAAEEEAKKAAVAETAAANALAAQDAVADAELMKIKQAKGLGLNKPKTLPTSRPAMKSMESPKLDKVMFKAEGPLKPGKSKKSKVNLEESYKKNSMTKAAIQKSISKDNKEWNPKNS